MNVFGFVVDDPAFIGNQKSTRSSGCHFKKVFTYCPAMFTLAFIHGIQIHRVRNEFIRRVLFQGLTSEMMSNRLERSDQTKLVRNIPSKTNKSSSGNQLSSASVNLLNWSSSTIPDVIDLIDKRKTQNGGSHKKNFLTVFIHLLFSRIVFFIKVWCF